MLSKHTQISPHVTSFTVITLVNTVQFQQEAQERERAQLITRATVAEEQVSELKEYVDNHLGRYLNTHL